MEAKHDKILEIKNRGLILSNFVEFLPTFIIFENETSTIWVTLKIPPVLVGFSVTRFDKFLPFWLLFKAKLTRNYFFIHNIFRTT